MDKLEGNGTHLLYQFYYRRDIFLSFYFMPTKLKIANKPIATIAPE